MLIYGQKKTEFLFQFKVEVNFLEAVCLKNPSNKVSKQLSKKFIEPKHLIWLSRKLK